MRQERLEQGQYQDKCKFQANLCIQQCADRIFFEEEYQYIGGQRGEFNQWGIQKRYGVMLGTLFAL